MSQTTAHRDPVRAQPEQPALSSQPALKGISYEAFLDLEERYRHAEWVEGEVFMMAPVSYVHGRIVRFLKATLQAYAEARRLGEVIGDPFQMELPSSGRQPDVMFVAAANAPRIRAQFLDGPADLAVEVICPGRRAVDRVEKFREYAAAGVREYWLIDPDRRQVEFFLLDEQRRFSPTLIGEDGIDHCTVIPGVWIDTNWLWERPGVVEVFRAWGAI